MRQEIPITILLICLLQATVDSFNVGIIDGHKAKPHSRPYMVSLQSNGQHFCGGFLIAKKWVMTAGHCSPSANSAEVVVGAHNIKKKEPSQERLQILEQYRHPKYYVKDDIPYNDIMLLKLARAPRLTKQVQIIALPKKDHNISVNTICDVAGWGKTEQGCLSKFLMEVSVPIISQKSCSKFFPTLDKTMMCANKPPSRKDSSQGDSGGPLVCNGVAEGIVSFGTHKPPGVYAQISRFLPWISRIMKKAEAYEMSQKI
ncbi:duodenase-1-like [Protopterus annectens]|uniref:duodenase-1-like n=1 Tax=Protopterus annectens TaxID=7888 RepID=UPI001CFBB6E1|nr:duodenase-1-like [Protopterus annectens]